MRQIPDVRPVCWGHSLAYVGVLLVSKLVSALMVVARTLSSWVGVDPKTTLLPVSYPISIPGNC